MSEISTEFNHQLLVNASEGDEKAFAKIFYEYSPSILAFSKKLSNDSLEAEEILQNVFLRVWVHRDKLTEIQNIKGWLYKFVVNESLSYIRKKTLRDKADTKFKRELISSDNNIEGAMNLNELKRLVAEAVNCLPEQRRKIFNLSRNEGLNIAEIAELLHISPHTVKNTLVAALKFIRDFLRKYGYSSYIFIFLIIRQLHFFYFSDSPILLEALLYYYMITG